MDKIYWMLWNSVALVAAILFAYITSISSENTTVSPLPTPTVNEATVKRNNLTITVYSFETEKEANEAFLTQFSGANVRPLGDVLGNSGYSGYYAWYDNTTATHIILLDELTVSVITTTDTRVLDNKKREPVTKEYLLGYLERNK
jgi:hypothetical protein